MGQETTKNDVFSVFEKLVRSWKQSVVVRKRLGKKSKDLLRLRLLHERLEDGVLLELLSHGLVEVASGGVVEGAGNLEGLLLPLGVVGGDKDEHLEGLERGLLRRVDQIINRRESRFQERATMQRDER